MLCIINFDMQKKLSVREGVLQWVVVMDMDRLGVLVACTFVLESMFVGVE